MTQAELVYDYLKRTFSENEPIFVSQLNISGMSGAAIRQQLAKLTKDGRLKRYTNGIYFLPKKSIFRSGSMLSADSIIKKKYLVDGTERCGYISGMLFANQLGITTQVPMQYEVSTNKATTGYREIKLAQIRVVLRKPCMKVTDKNADALQFLDLLKEIVDISEIEGKELTERLLAYMEEKGLSFDSLKPYFDYYPERIYKNMYKVGLFNGIPS